jgi:hypothetical protein
MSNISDEDYVFSRELEESMVPVTPFKKDECADGMCTISGGRRRRSRRHRKSRKSRRHRKTRRHHRSRRYRRR